MNIAVEGLSNTITLLPTQGIGSIRFGMSILEVEQLFGELPKEIEETPEQDTTLEYPTYGISFLFDAEVDQKLTSIDIDQFDRVELYGKSLVGASKSTLIALLQEQSIPFSEEVIGDPTSEHILEEYIAAPNFGLELYLDESHYLASISMGIYIDEDDCFHWPTD
ncbi:MAG: hypothetical protein AAGD25_02815 [Cyanobacteria bacterium P01_F01_bin.150]